MSLRELRTEAASRKQHAEHRRLSMSAAGIQETLQGGDDSEGIVDLEFCQLLQRIAVTPEAKRSPAERALMNRLDELAWKITEGRDYSDAYDEEQMTRAEQEWEARRDCALLEHQA